VIWIAAAIALGVAFVSARMIPVGSASIAGLGTLVLCLGAWVFAEGLYYGLHSNVRMALTVLGGFVVAALVWTADFVLRLVG
jgi:hypothetical protein